MPRHYDVGTRVYFKVTFGLYASFCKAVQLTDEVLRVKNYTCTDKAESIRIENTGRDEVELVNLSVVYYGMTGIVAAL